jgi:hypothetical protein
MTETMETFIAAAREGLALQTASHASAWHLGRGEEWAADLDRGEITFQFKDGVTAIAPIQVIGTYNSKDGTFLWGWDHPSVPQPLRAHAKLALEWGKSNNLPAFTSRKVVCTEDEAWSFAAVANRLAGANGAYKGPSGSTLVFMTFGQVKISKQ